MKKKVISVVMDPGLFEALKELSRRSGVSHSTLIRTAVKKLLAEYYINEEKNVMEGVSTKKELQKV